MAVLFRPVIPVDNSHYGPALQKALGDFDFRIGPDAGNPADIDYLISWKLFPGDGVRWPRLKAILALGAGVNQYVGHPEFPPQAALIRMIEPGLSQGMAEYVASFVLRFHRQHDHFKSMGWTGQIPRLAQSRTIGILGMGEMGLACAQMLIPLGFRLRGWSQTPKTIPGLESFAGPEKLHDFLSGSEILVCLLPLTEGTRNILNRKTLGSLPRGACLVNAGRGPHLVDEDLLALLDSGHIDQAALDVFHEEPLPEDHPFHAHPRIHVSPHIAAITVPETGAESIRKAIQQLERGERPAGWVDRAQGY